MSLYLYRYILYFVLAVKENKNPKYIGKRGDVGYIHNFNPNNLVYSTDVDFNYQTHPLSNLLLRCGLKPINAWTECNNYYILLHNITYRNHDKVKKIQNKFDRISIKEVFDAYPYMGSDLYTKAFYYLRNANLTRFML